MPQYTQEVVSQAITQNIGLPYYGAKASTTCRPRLSRPDHESIGLAKLVLKRAVSYIPG